jgi:RNA polymerase sigma-70 factor, ECF subfamily
MLPRSPSNAGSLLIKFELVRKSARICGALPADPEAGVRRMRNMSNSFAEFLTRLRSQDDSAAQELFERFAHQLICLAHRHICAGLRHKVDPEDIVQSAYKSFFLRYGAGKLDVVNWNSLWGLLTLITVRKCAERATYHRAERRDDRREVSLQRGDEPTSWLDPLGREPTPFEAAVLSETVDQLLADLDEDERPILELSLQGHTTREISERLGRAERTVRLLRESIRHKLERMQHESF